MNFYPLVVIFTLLFFLSACSSAPSAPSNSSVATEAQSERPDNASNYHEDLVYPKETTNFVFDNMVQYDDPFYGAALSYIDNRDYPDIITVFVYPIAATLWSNEDLALNSEVDAFIQELDNTVKVGAYQNRSPETKSNFTVNKDDENFKGKKVHFEFINKQGLAFNADAYFFIQKDKYIKIRTSSRKDFTPDWNGDLITQELLPEFVVPDESEFMKNLRNEYRNQARQQTNQ